MIQYYLINCTINNKIKSNPHIIIKSCQQPSVMLYVIWEITIVTLETNKPQISENGCFSPSLVKSRLVETYYFIKGKSYL